MTMTLQEILKSQGLSDEQIEKVTGEMKQNKIFLADEENLGIRYKKLKDDHDALTKQHGEATTLIEELKKGNKGNEQLQSKITAYETQVADLQAELEKTKVESAIKVALLSAKALDVDYLTFKLKEKGEMKLDDQGNIKGIDDMIAGLKTQFPTQFETASQKKIEEHKLPNGDDNKKISQEDFNKMGYQDRLKVYNENPELYNELSGHKTD
jgi:hypothetical protein|nr:MAG TPA: minor structural protein [Caudoviricetes sp.]